MIRLGLFSGDDALHRALRGAAGRQGDLSLEVSWRSLPEVRSAGGLDVAVLDLSQRRGRTDEPADEVLDELRERLSPLPLVLVSPEERTEAEFPRATGDRILAAARALAYGLQIADPSSALHQILPLTHSSGLHPLISADENLSLSPAGAPPAEATGLAGPDDLTPREHEVLQLLARGCSNADIADRLGLSVNTVKYHLAALYATLNAGSRSEAVWQAIRRGLVAL